jgi:predicted DNA-binding protein
MKKRERQFDEQIALRLPSDLKDRLEHDAATKGRSIGNMTRRILERWYAEHRPEVAA